MSLRPKRSEVEKSQHIEKINGLDFSATLSLLTPNAERSNLIKTHITIIHFHSIFKVNYIHSKKSIHLLTAVFLSRNGVFF